MSTITTAQVGVAAALVLALGACNPRDRRAADSTVTTRADTAAGRIGATMDTAARRVGTAMDTARRRMESAAGSIARRNGWTDASILAFASAADQGDMREGSLATRKATNPDVKAFARQMVADHRALLNEGKSLASKLEITPDTTSSEVRDLVKHTRDELADLTEKQAGADWDREYIDDQIDEHKDVLDKLQDAAKSTSNAELRTALEKATGKVQEHLTKAQSIKDNQLKS